MLGSIGYFVLLVLGSVLAIFGIEVALAFVGVGGTARYEHMVSVLTSRIQLLLDENGKLTAQIETTRKDTYPRIAALDVEVAALKEKVAALTESK